MKALIFTVSLLIAIPSFSQEKNITSIRDTISLAYQPRCVKLVALEINGVTLIESYLDLLDMYKHLKKSQFRDGRKKLNACIAYLKKGSRNKDTVYVTKLIENNLDMGHTYIFFCRNMNEGRVIVRARGEVIQNSIIREKLTYHGGMQSWGASRYYLLNDKIHFLQISDWRS